MIPAEPNSHSPCAEKSLLQFQISFQNTSPSPAALPSCRNLVRERAGSRKPAQATAFKTSLWRRHHPSDQKAKEHVFPFSPVNSVFIRSSAEPQTIWCGPGGTRHTSPFYFHLLGQRTRLPPPQDPPWRIVLPRQGSQGEGKKKKPPKLCFQFLQHYIISIVCAAKSNCSNIFN